MTAPELKAAADSLFRRVGQALAEKGFRRTRKRGVWNRAERDVVHVLDLQRGRVFDAAAREFVWNWGVSVPGLQTLIYGADEPVDRDIGSVAISGRVSHLLGGQGEWMILRQGMTGNEFEAVTGGAIQQAERLSAALRVFADADAVYRWLRGRPEKPRLIFPINETWKWEILAGLAILTGKDQDARQALHQFEELVRAGTADQAKWLGKLSRLQSAGGHRAG